MPPPNCISQSPFLKEILKNQVLKNQDSKNVFHIKNLECQYLPGKTVLHVKELELPEKELIFILGVSGIGKSTFIETLGLMNKTIAKNDDTNILFYPNSGDGIELKNIWDSTNQKISAFRNDYFSFIFQDTNLMPNFSAGENMCISQLIHGVNFLEAKNNVLQVMEELNLSDEVFDKKITALSGGQRQRLAFVRAITVNFKVLFGDEPTGNLDRDTAYRLMNNVKKNLQKKNGTGVIVSHDINLAMNFADRIVILTKKRLDEDHVMGELMPENIVHRQGDLWYNSHGDKVNNVYTLILRNMGMEVEQTT